MFVVSDHASAAPLPEGEVFAMNTARSQLEGSEYDSILDFGPSHHWACGMPLSWVLETADRCLHQNGRAEPVEIYSASDSAA